jgi:hypothetical protein
MADRTRDVMSERIRGLKWLGNATLEEYSVGLWLEENGYHGRYAFQGLFNGYRGQVRTDFLMFTGGQLALEVQGDHFHGGIPLATADRQRRLLLQEQGAHVVEIWGHDIVKYDNHEMPTDESFQDLMEAAMNGVQLSSRLG